MGHILMASTSIKRYLLLIAGIVAVCLGFIGIFVPLLPTTPFLLLAAACFVRSSKRLHDWLLNHRWFGSYIRYYKEHGAVAFRGKIWSIAILWVAIGYAAIFEVANLTMRVLLVMIAVSVTIHILRLKTLNREMVEQSASKRRSARSEATGEVYDL